MAVDFLGSAPRPKREKAPEVPYHMPQDESKLRKEAEKQKKERAELRQTAARDTDLDLTDEYYRGARRRRILTGIALAVILTSSAGLWYALSRQQPQQPIAQEQPPNVQQPAPSTPQQPQPTPPPAVLPDTPLAPLRGSLVRFSDESVIYLVENNGELRRVITQRVIFANGQRMAQISPQLVYVINGSWKATRHGSEDVTGQVDFDPRVLDQSELQPFL